MPQSSLEDRDWDTLMKRIQDGKCTPFLGAGACEGTLPLGAEIARKWATEYRYPLRDSAGDLVRVSQFLAVERGDEMFPKEEMLKILKTDKLPDFSAPDEPHAALADMPLPVYITTNYDDFMMRALANRGKKPIRELCRWNDDLSDYPSVFESDGGFTPTTANPVVFHLHGNNDKPESLVLTEDDYLDFLVKISEDNTLLPPRIQAAVADASLLFIGYGLADWSFRVLFRGLVNAKAKKRRSFMVQLLPVDRDTEAEASRQVQGYLNEYFDDKDIKVYWGTAREFTAELRQHWKDFSNATPQP